MPILEIAESNLWITIDRFPRILLDGRYIQIKRFGFSVGLDAS